MLGIVLSLILNFERVDLDQHKCLSQTIFHESRGEPLKGQFAVAEVVVGRTQHNEFPNTICEVVHQRNQFAWINDVKRSNWRTNSTTDVISYLTIFKGKVIDLSAGNLFFSVGGFKNSRLAFSEQIGNHKFYRIVN